MSYFDFHSLIAVSDYQRSPRLAVSSTDERKGSKLSERGEHTGTIPFAASSAQSKETKLISLKSRECERSADNSQTHHF